MILLKITLHTDNKGIPFHLSMKKMCNKGLETSPLYGATHILLHGPLGDIPEDTHAVVTQNGIGVDTLDGIVCDEHCINVS